MVFNKTWLFMWQKGKVFFFFSESTLQEKTERVLCHSLLPER